MNENVIEIVSYLVKRIMHNENIVENEKKLIKNLIDQGYEVDDIDMAFELIFTSSMSSAEKESEDELKFDDARRVLDFKEKFKLSLPVQGALIRLSALSLISNTEVENILEKSLHFRESEIGLKHFWKVLQKVINNPARLSLIIENSPEFKSINEEHKRYIN